jgi:hypothetical protein
METAAIITLSCNFSLLIVTATQTVCPGTHFIKTSIPNAINPRVTLEALRFFRPTLAFMSSPVLAYLVPSIFHDSPSVAFQKIGSLVRHLDDTRHF